MYREITLVLVLLLVFWNVAVSAQVSVGFFPYGDRIRNGNFEEEPYVFPPLEDNSPLPGWTIESLEAIKLIDKAHFAVPEGNRAIELVGGKKSVISQIVRTTPGIDLALTFKVGDAKDACEGLMAVEAFAGSNKIMVNYISKGEGGFILGRLVFKAVSLRTRVVFMSTFYHTRSDHSGSVCGPVIDDVSLKRLFETPKIDLSHESP